MLTHLNIAGSIGLELCDILLVLLLNLRMQLALAFHPLLELLLQSLQLHAVVYFRLQVALEFGKCPV